MKSLAMGATILKEAIVAWNEDKVPRLGAALAYYTLFSLAPLLMIVVAVASLVFGEQAAQGQIADEIKGLVGDKGADAIQAILQNAGARKSSGVVATVIGITTLLFGASGVFGELQDALNTIWGVKPKPGRGVLGIVRSRFFSFAMVLGIGFLLLVSLVLSAVIAAAGKFFQSHLPVPEPVLHLGSTVVTFLMVTILFMLLYKVVPDVHIEWRDVVIGAAVTALLFSIGKFLIGLYLGKASVGSAYGAAGSIVVFMVWVYYSAQIFFLGAEFTHVFAERHGSRAHQRAGDEVAPAQAEVNRFRHPKLA